MSRIALAVLSVLLALPLGLRADPPHAVDRLSACKTQKYNQKLNELNAEYRSCIREFTRYAHENPSGGGSPAVCGNTYNFDSMAKEYAKKNCVWGTEEEISGNPNRMNPNQNSVTVNGDRNEFHTDECISVPGVFECPTADASALLVVPPVRPEPPTAGAGSGNGGGGSGGGSGRTSGGAIAGGGAAAAADPATGQQPGTSGNPSMQDPGSAQYEAQSDLAMCQRAQSTATRCCGNPKSCAGTLPPADQQRLAQLLQGETQAPTSGQALADYCAMLDAATQNGASINSMMSSICYGQMTTCEGTCDSLINKYQTLYSTCNGCASAQVYSQTYNQLKSYRSVCGGLSSRAQQLAQQGGDTSYAGGRAAACRDMAATPQGLNIPVPQLAGDSTGGAPRGTMGASSASADCATNPNFPGCQRLAVREQTDRAGDAGFGTVEKTETPTFNLPDTSDFPRPGDPIAGRGTPAQPPTYGTVPNNAGGGIPGGEGASPASLGKAGRAGSPGSPGYNTDVLQSGLSAGGGYSQPNGQNQGASGDNMWRIQSGGRAGSEAIHPLVGLDLKQYLPGGARDPNRKVAGVSRSSQINPKEENIWRIISVKFEEKCKLGVLWRCRSEDDKQK